MWAALFRLSWLLEREFLGDSKGLKVISAISAILNFHKYTSLATFNSSFWTSPRVGSSIFERVTQIAYIATYVRACHHARWHSIRGGKLVGRLAWAGWDGLAPIAFPADGRKECMVQ